MRSLRAERNQLCTNDKHLIVQSYKRHSTCRHSVLSTNAVAFSTLQQAELDNLCLDRVAGKSCCAAHLVCTQKPHSDRSAVSFRLVGFLQGIC
jgi:hypothetical protein